MNNTSIVFLTDSYRFSHHKQYPSKTEHVYSYFESRGGKFDETTFFGLQYLLKKYLSTPITQEEINLAEDLVNIHIGPDIFNKKGWEYILDKHKGYLPLEIKAVSEGTTVPVKNVLMTIVNTDPACYWLTNYLETLLVQTWYPTTVCSQSREMKKIISKYSKKTSEDQFIDFKLHDFGFRGSTSVESSALGGAAHLVNFMGTDTFSALMLLREHYDAPMAGFSLPAAEHSTITSWGKENEVKAFENMLDKFPDGLVAVVSDSFDIYNACENLWGTELKEKIENRNGTLVVRPDSGPPPEVVANVLNILGEKFGYTTNSKGYKTLPPYIRVIQGDGIDINMLDLILENMERCGWSTENTAFGSGGGLLQKVDRDTCKFAFKCSEIIVNGESRDVWKDPITDPGKRSKRGRLALVRNEQGLLTSVPESDIITMRLENELKLVFRNGQLFNTQTLDDIRRRAAIV